MNKDIIRVSSISQMHELMGFDKPSHPLISIINVADLEITEEWLGVKMAFELYGIALKDKSCAMDYGRNSYDFNEGVMMFTAPGQVMASQKVQARNEIQGWWLHFHPDLIRNTSLAQKIDQYHFFSYDVHEALHLSEEEQKTVDECIKMMADEISARIDNHSQSVITSGLQLLLNYSNRYYERQFNTRMAHHSDVVSQFEMQLKKYYQSGQWTQAGAPSIDYFAEKAHLSPNYLSDLLKKNTGLSAKEHINRFIVEKAKTLLLSENDSISGLAYQLGFNYPHYFSRLFKAHTGLSPQEYRESN